LLVFVLDKRKRPVMPCCEKRARPLLECGRAVVHRRYPFTIRLKDRVDVEPVRVTLGPDSTTTGIAAVADEDGNKPARVLCLFELAHRGRQISEAPRRAFRRRSANLRYRLPRLDNRRKPQGWLAPSLQHRVDTCISWRKRLHRLAPVLALSVERVRFDMQLLENPEILGVEYQQGTLGGYEIREYVFEKFERHCAYCGITDVPPNLDHIHPRSRGGSKPCEQSRCGAYPQQHRTKFNRSRLKIPQTHALDAACVGGSGRASVGSNRPSQSRRAEEETPVGPS
jgi:hypothetical protein